jgi:hypothetical protein
MGRLQNIEEKIDGINGHVRNHCTEIAWAKGLGWGAMVLSSAYWAAWKWWGKS